MHVGTVARIAPSGDRRIFHSLTTTTILIMNSILKFISSELGVGVSMSICEPRPSTRTDTNTV